MLEKQEIIIRQTDFKSQKTETLCDIFVYEPESIPEKALGNFYLITQQLTDKEKFSSIPNLINSSLKRNFYKEPKLGPRPSLKKALEETNIVLREISREDPSFDFEKLFYLIAVAKDETMHLAASGKNVALLFEKSGFTDLNEKMAPPPQNRSRNKFFQSLVSVQLQPGNKVFLATPNLEKTISLKKIIQTAKEKKLINTSEKIKMFAKNQKEPTSLAVLLLKYRRPRPNTPPQKNRSGKKYITPPIDLWKILK